MLIELVNIPDVVPQLRVTDTTFELSVTSADTLTLSLEVTIVEAGV
jgi:hypothetical protein